MRGVPAMLLAVAALAAAAQAADPAARRAADAFQEWALGAGCKMHPSLRVDAIRSAKAAAKSPDSVDPRTLRWRLVIREPEEGESHVEPVLPDDDMVACSFNAMLAAPTPETLESRGGVPPARIEAMRKLETLGFTREDLLALELLYHDSLGDLSTAHQLMQTLPRSQELNALSMGPAEAAVLKGTATGTAIRELQDQFGRFVSLVGEHEAAVLAAFPMGDVSGTGLELEEDEPRPTGPTDLGEARLRWASSMVLQRARGIQTARGAVPCIVPVLHVAGHSPSVLTTYAVTRRGFKATHAGPSHQPRGSDERATPGKEVLVNYMPRRWNADLLAFFGRTSSSEVHSALHIHSSDPPGMDAARRHSFDRSSELLRLMGLSNGVLISPLGISTAALNVARIRAMENPAFTINGLRTVGSLNSRRALDDGWLPDADRLKTDPGYAAAELAWVLGRDGSPARHALPEGEDGPVAGTPLNPHQVGIRVPINLEQQAVRGLLDALITLRDGVFPNSTAADDAALIKAWRVRPRKRSQAPGSTAAADPNPTSGPRLLREAVRARMQEKAAVEASIRDAEARLRATQSNGAAAVGGVGWSTSLVDPSVRTPAAKPALSADEVAAQAEVEASGDAGSV